MPDPDSPTSPESAPGASLPEEPPSGAAALPAIDVQLLDEAWLEAIPGAEALARRAALAALADEGAGRFAGAELSLVLGDDALLRQLNRDYRDKDRPTNVLSFPMERERPAGGGPWLLGDLALARETLLREAAAQGKRPADHLSHLVVHGVLHLLGHDHEADAEAEAMEAAERAVLAGLGIADPYDEDPVQAPLAGAGGRP